MKHIAPIILLFGVAHITNAALPDGAKTQSGEYLVTNGGTASLSNALDSVAFDGESDPAWAAVSNTVTANAANGQTAHGWGDHSTNGYYNSEPDLTALLDDNYQPTNANLTAWSAYSPTAYSNSLANVWEAYTDALSNSLNIVAFDGESDPYALTNTFDTTALSLASTVTVTQADGNLVSTYLTNTTVLAVSTNGWTTNDVGTIRWELYAGTNSVSMETNNVMGWGDVTVATNDVTSLLFDKPKWSLTWYVSQYH